MHRRALIAVAATFAVIVGLAMPAFSTGSVGTASGFEDDDANLVVNSTFDWNGFSPVTWSTNPAAPYRTTSKLASGWSFKGFEDAAVSTTDSGFAGGVKQDNDCGTYKPGKAPNKDDLKRIYLSTKTVSGDVFLNLAWVRIPQNSTTASAHVGFEFNQADGSVVANQCGSPNPLVKRTGGDMLVVYDFEGGSAAPAIKLSRWLTTAWFADHSGTGCEVNNSTVAAGCWGNTKIISDLGFAEGKVNLVTETDSIKPPGATNPGPVEFGEAGINLTDAGVFTANQCTGFGSAYAVSRSSGNSSQAAMEDIVGPGAFAISNCPKVNIVKTGGNAPLAGAKFELFQPAGVVNGVPTGTSKYSCTTGTDGTCTMSDVVPGVYTLDETVVPTGYTKASGLPQEVTVVSGTDQTLTFEDPPAPGHVDITKLDDAGDPVVGATFQLYSPQGIANGAPTGSAVTGKSCTTGLTGTCTISNVTPGDYTLDETVVPTGYAKDAALPENITVTNGGTVTKSYTDPRKFKVIVIVCRQTDNTLYPSDIKIDAAAAGKSLSSAQATTAGLSESALCGISTGSKGNLRAAPDSSNPHDADIDIPNKQT